MRWLLVLIAYVVGWYGSDFHRRLGIATGVVSRTQERSATPQMAEDLNILNGCGMEGDARSLAVQALDRLENRYTMPGPNEIDPKITLEGILAPGNDVSRWKVLGCDLGADLEIWFHQVPIQGVPGMECIQAQTNGEKRYA
jgi:hypothetical protein